MRLIRHLNNREKMMLSFLVLLIVLNGLTILVSRNLGGFSLSFKSMLEDRLIPSYDLGNMEERLYKNRLVLSERLVLFPSEKPLVQQMESNDADIDQVTLKYAETYLTADEAQVFEQFKRQLKAYRKLEQQMIHLAEKGDTQAAKTIYLEQGLPAFDHLLSTIRKLKNIQVKVGEELYREAGRRINILQLIGYLSLAIALMLTVYMLKVLQFKVK